MSGLSELDELRFKIIKSILIESPQLRERVKKWLQEKEDPK